MKRSILITGAGSGIGAGIATELAAGGHHLIVSDMDLAAAERTAQRLRDAGGSAEALALDVTDDHGITQALARVTRAPQVLVNNAGLQQVAALEDFPMQRWALLVDVMLTGAARLSRALLPGMRAAGYGRIVNIGSIHSLVASPYKSAYVAAKHGLVGLAKVIALETADCDITVNTLCPSYVRTPLVERQIADQARTRGIAEEAVIRDVMLKPMPKGAFIDYDELAGTVAFLMSHAARNITGQAIAIDGGWTAQ
ncbi:3-hydroxybutyrate dehydrogenase [Xanthomonas arboricola]|nr:3-hydroxybutyrate dehydrogenase [Xanthomonas arboricola]AKU52159.1 3-hydroxybutyrate dehydrogenase [Xanthomonas arboricola pv. juglandis]KOA97142.1 3-hydroxybutyrate dehydrogenase [Xanthomonas arboricola]KOB00210.1 3-hydroxybutyrate dehydrogenase [Xanthomonas arboricola]KOB06292.1 3-hydroxybutyrate dehydrogenase [Xanthomonas arboricola]KOB11968.1 3-hydroxybutyrate dehydrogenase [Xanthomonas arboricola]